MAPLKSWYQHGDVIIRQAPIPPHAHHVGTRILAQGESTGHAHRLTDDSDVEVYEHEGTLFLRVGPGKAGLTHEEHGLGVVDTGEYRVDRVQEYDHFAEEARPVQD